MWGKRSGSGSPDEAITVAQDNAATPVESPAFKSTRLMDSLVIKADKDSLWRQRAQAPLSVRDRYKHSRDRKLAKCKRQDKRDPHLNSDKNRSIVLHLLLLYLMDDAAYLPSQVNSIKGILLKKDQRAYSENLASSSMPSSRMTVESTSKQTQSAVRNNSWTLCCGDITLIETKDRMISLLAVWYEIKDFEHRPCNTCPITNNYHGYHLFKRSSSSSSQPIYVPLLGTGLLSEQKGLGYSSHAGPARIVNFTRTIELLRRLFNSMRSY
ncbi:hypothetical protein MSG28_010400 [Choristoneura fumiferana]|uniref:Uncharacterized protein n=1 Tax=Choristoneura fumiferana TaxID=7141 RepID=A0ACC0KKE8_CHOFU|nr:hypothetical protein MSG28_010400 [Choristoneura fumiferana]